MGGRLRALHSLKTSGRLRQQNLVPFPSRTMTSKTSHEERTAADIREPGMHTVVLDDIEQFNQDIRLLRLRTLGEKPKARDSIQ